MIKLLVDGIVFQRYPNGGIARVYREILPRMCNSDSELFVNIFIDGPVSEDLPTHPQITIQKAPAVKRTIRVSGVGRSLIYPIRRVASRSWNTLRSLWLGTGDDVIWHSTFYTVPRYWRGPQVVTVHDMIQERFPELYNDRLDEVGRRQKRECIDSANVIICNSETTHRDLIRFYGDLKDKMVYVTPWASSEIFQPLEADVDLGTNLPEDPFLLYVGGRWGYKNFANLLDVYCSWDGRESVALVVVGQPWEKDEWQKIEHLGVSERVHLVTGVDDQFLCKLYNRALAFVYPSIYEGFGIPLLEAMACGCPVVASHIPSSVEIAGDCPIYFDPNIQESLLTAIEQARIEGRGSHRVSIGLERIKCYSWDRTAHETLEIYRTMYSK